MHGSSRAEWEHRSRMLAKRKHQMDEANRKWMRYQRKQKERTMIDLIHLTSLTTSSRPRVVCPILHSVM